MNSPALIVTNRYDPHVDLVADCLSELRTPFVRFHPDELADNAAMQISPDRSEVRLLDSGLSFNPRDLRSVWYRRPEPIEVQSANPHEAVFVTNELKAVLDDVYSQIDSLWVSHPDALRAARNKLLQLRLAVRLGFSVPDYVVSSDTNSLRTLLNEGPCVVKAIASSNCVVEANELTIGLETKALTHEILNDFEGARLMHPLLVQRRVPKAFDVRVTVIGKELTAVAIDVPTEEVDSRPSWGAATHRRVSIPEELNSKMLEYMKRLQLSYGAFDFIVDPKSNWWFLECNPNGQFAWMDFQAKTSLVKQMANLLSKGSL
jgi:glutathione synthase/RimK-type ligase-like ATP-grasp enzyme